MTDTITLTEGGTATFTGTWPDGNGGGADLSAFTIGAAGLHKRMVGRISIAFVDASAGTFAGRIDHHASMPRGRVMSFRIALTARPEYPGVIPPQPTEPIFVEVR